MLSRRWLSIQTGLNLLLTGFWSAPWQQANYVHYVLHYWPFAWSIDQSRVSPFHKDSGIRWPFVWGIDRSRVSPLHKESGIRSLIISSLLVWTRCWTKSESNCRLVETPWRSCDVTVLFIYYSKNIILCGCVKKINWMFACNGSTILICIYALVIWKNRFQYYRENINL